MSCFLFYFFKLKLLKVKHNFTGMKYLNVIPIRRNRSTKMPAMTLNKNAMFFVIKSSYLKQLLS
jgi:hypothetical protein